MSDSHQRPNHHSGKGNEVLDAALQLFADKGFASTSVREIVLKAGLTKPALYYHFGSKEGLLRAILEEGLAEFEARVHENVDTAVDARDALVKFMETCFEVASRKPEIASLIYQVIFGPEGSSPGIDVSDITRRNTALMMYVIERAVREGLIQETNAEQALLLLSGLLNIHLMAYLKGHLKQLDPEMAHQAVDFYLWGVAGRASERSTPTVREG